MQSQKLAISTEKNTSLLLTLFCAIAMLSFPKHNSIAALQKSGRPRIGKYSWSSKGSTAICVSTYFTTGNTHGTPSSVRKAVKKIVEIW